MKDWKKTIIPPTAQLIEAVQKLDESAAQICLVSTQDGYLVGTITDGDVRRAILRGVPLTESVVAVMNPHPVTARDSDDPITLLTEMRRDQFRHIPLLDVSGRLTGMVTADELLQPADRPNWVVLMAGGEGRRLRPLTEDTPKPLLSVGDKPILETILTTLTNAGFRQFYLSVNYRAERVRDYFGDGSKWGVQIEYLHESRKLGTAGALGLLPSIPSHPILVMNGDILTNVNFAKIVDFHEEQGNAATMCVRTYSLDIPYGVVEVDGMVITGIKEKPTYTCNVNAGIYVMSPDVMGLIEPNTPVDMPELFLNLIKRNEKCSVFQVRDYWTDIGAIDDFNRANSDFNSVFGFSDDV